MFVQIGNRAFNPQHITKVIFHSKGQVTVRLTGDSEIGFGAIEGAEFLAWYEIAPVIVAHELMETKTTDTEPFEDRVYADALADFEKLAERKRRRGAGYTANPLAHFEKRTDAASEMYAELLSSGVEPAEAAHLVDTVYGFDDRTAMADSRDSAGV